jgi:aspartate 1-decarboxylase
MQEYEQIDVYNVNNGERFTTYIILAEPGSCIVCVNGAAARKVQVGDRIIIVSYGLFDEVESSAHEPKVLKLNEKNLIVN